MKINILKRIMVKNDAIGQDNRDIFLKKNIYAINFLSSPGAGKTTLLENSLQFFCKKYKTAVIEGDLFTSKDALRLEKFDIPITQINTEGGCHLDAKMVSEALLDFDLEHLDLFFIENVGNLVCPASFDLGEHLRVLLYSVTEGEDKPKKYATMFRDCHVILINKIDLAEICNIDIEKVEKDIREINPTAKIFKISAINSETLNTWVEWLDEEIRKNRAV